MAQVQVTIECGYCLRKEEDLPTPKILPCSHVHCMQCLCGFFDDNHKLVCPLPNCGETVEESPDTLPSYNMIGEDKFCDICVEKMDKQEAVIYCTVCSIKFCAKHLMSHDDTMDGHNKIHIVEYKSHTTETQTGNCIKHEDQPYLKGCRLCLNLLCINCIYDQGKCDNGASHNLLSLDDLVAALIKEEIRAEMMAKEDEYEKLFKKASKTRAAYDLETAEMVELIHKTRDAQVHETRDAQVEAPNPKYKKLEDVKYKKLEEEVMERRQKSSLAIAEFMDDLVLRKWTQLRNHRKMMESRLRCSRLVDVVKGLKQLKEEIQKFVEEELPKLHLIDEIQLKKLDVNGSVELEVVSSRDIAIDSELPQATQMLKSVKLKTYPLSICQYNEFTYVGLANGKVARIDQNYRLRNTFITTGGAVLSISVYKDKFYTLSMVNEHVVNVHDMSGGHITMWTHPYGYQGRYSNLLTIVADQVVVGDPASARIAVYSLTGETLRHIPIPSPLLGRRDVHLCAADDNSVVVSDGGSSKVFRVNMNTGEVMWTFSDLNRPKCLVQYGSYILLGAHEDKTIHILNLTTGKIVSEIADGVEHGRYAKDMGMSGTTLAVPLYTFQQVHFYQLKYEMKE